MHDEILSVEEAARKLAHLRTDNLTAEQRVNILRIRPSSESTPKEELEQAHTNALFGATVRSFRNEILLCISSGHLVPVNPLTGFPSPEMAVLAADATVRFCDIQPAFEKSRTAILKVAAKEGTTTHCQQPEPKQTTVAAGQRPEHPAPPEQIAPINHLDDIPGRLPNTSIGQMAIRAAWKIEQETGRSASSKAVMNQLQQWADNGDFAEVLIKSIESKRAVRWHTKSGVEKTYDEEACRKALSSWNKSRA